ncbi:MAG: DNA mismatch endonuclease Vsr [Niastella sp.]|nr:DNA mismatch endonuclease Vsr [Niastella sp.]
MDKVDKITRSRNMAAVRSRGNQTTEKKMASLLRQQKWKGWRRHYSIEGTPDFCWPKQKVALFVDGCFWHGCPRCYKVPKSNVEFWENKISGNRKRDRHVLMALKKRGWLVLRVWECQLEKPRTVYRIRKALDVTL